jgi:hypothetical protein
MSEGVAAIHIDEAELAQDIAAVVIGRGAKPVAVLRAAEPRRRKLSEIAASLLQGSTALLDSGFAADVQAVIDSHCEPLKPLKWDYPGWFKRVWAADQRRVRR